MYTEAFQLEVIASVKVSELRKLVFEKLEENSFQKPSSPLHIRLREMYAYSPSTIFPNSDNVTLCECAENLVFDGKPIAFQFLDAEESITSRDSVVPIIQRWNPSSCSFGPRTEFVLSRDMAIEDLRNLLSKQFGIESVGLAKSKSDTIFFYFFPIFNINF